MIPIWLNTVNPRKVHPGIREKVELYQSKCVDVLYLHCMPHLAPRVGVSRMTWRADQGNANARRAGRNDAEKAPSRRHPDAWMKLN
jgi:hypothetical protein